MNFIKILEWFRCICVGFGFYAAYQPHLSVEASLYQLLLWVVIPIAGSTGIESVFFARASAAAKNRELGSAYQTQSGLNNIAVALTALMVWYGDWGAYASITVIAVLYIFLILSSINHLYEFLGQHNKKIIHLMRPILTIALLIGTQPLIVKVVC